MKNEKTEFVKDITNMEDDFAQWYTDVIKKADLVDYSPVKGFMVIKPYGYEIWENIQKNLDKRFKQTGHKNCYFPLLIPESLLTKEKEHVEGFAPEVAWVTQGGNETLGERLCVRPTSETIICYMYSKWLNSYRQLPFKYNQWANVVRWEKTTRPFLRTAEFLWQEGHTLHETQEEAKEEALTMLDIYKEIVEEYLAIPVITGTKSEKEKFAGADKTYTIEALMHDGKALQSGTSHELGQNFAKAYDITYQDRNSKLAYPFQTSWGVTTRLIGALIMVHGDNRGLVVPPRIAPTQVVIVPIQMNKEGVLDKANEIKNSLVSKGIRVELDDDTANTPGWKFNEYEMKGIPARIEIGPRDIQNGVATISRRDTNEKSTIELDKIADEIPALLEDIQKGLFEKAKKRRDEMTFVATDFDMFKERMANNQGLAKAMWCGDPQCEENIKKETAATIRCIPTEQEHLGDVCPFCGKPAKHMVYIAKAY